MLVAAGLSGCTTAPSGPTAGGPGTAASQTEPVERQRRALLRIVRGSLGSPYRYGGSSPRGFDCSGLVHYAHSQVGIEVPRTAQQQARQARLVRRAALRPGDLLFFDLGDDRAAPPKVHHVGIYEGEGRFIHAPSAGKRVSRGSLDNPYWRSRLRSAGSFL